MTPAPDTSPEAVERIAKRAESMAERGWCDDDIAPTLRALSGELARAREQLGRIAIMEPDQHSRTCCEMHRIANEASHG